MSDFISLGGRLRANAALPVEAAARIAQRIARYVADLEQNLRPSDDALPLEDMNDFERDEYQQFQAVWGMVEPMKTKLADTNMITVLLTGNMCIPSKTRKCWHVIRGTIQDHLRGWIAGQAGVEQLVVAQHDAALVTAPRGLMLLQRYVARLENAVE